MSPFDSTRPEGSVSTPRTPGRPSVWFRSLSPERTSLFGSTNLSSITVVWAWLPLQQAQPRSSEGNRLCRPPRWEQEIQPRFSTFLFASLHTKTTVINAYRSGCGRPWDAQKSSRPRNSLWEPRTRRKTDAVPLHRLWLASLKMCGLESYS